MQYKLSPLDWRQQWWDAHQPGSFCLPVAVNTGVFFGNVYEVAGF
jgi:hypothetical protein